MKKKCRVLALVLFTASALVGSVQTNNAALFSDDFQSYTTDPTGQSGGTGWNTAWTQGLQNNGGTYLNESTKIDGTRSYGLYGAGGVAGTSRNRGFAAISTQFTISWSFRADYNVTGDDGNASLSRRLAFTLRNGNSTDHFSGQRLSLFFAEGNGNLQWYDGTDHSSTLAFSQGGTYDFSLTVNPADRSYSFSAALRSGASYNSSGTWAGANGDSLGSVAFLMRGPNVSGSDAFLDSITAVPEPVNVALGIFGGLLGVVMLGRHWKARRASLAHG